jgi:lactoylglutathione lyase
VVPDRIRPAAERVAQPGRRRRFNLVARGDRMRLLHTMIRVKDLDRSVGWYRDALGLREESRRVLAKGDATILFLTDGGAEHRIELTYNHDGRDYDLGNQFGHFAFGVDDLDVERARLEKLGVSFARGPYQVVSGGSRIAFIKDPDGIEIELIETERRSAEASR